MPATKNGLIRYKILDNCFRNTGKRYFLEDLLEACDVVLASLNPDHRGLSRRQIFEDIAFMESEAGWSIDLERVRAGKKVYYRYRDPLYSINNMPLNEVEITQLQSALNILSQFKGMPQFDWVHELIAKLQAGVSPIESETIIEFDSNQFLKGAEHIGVIYQAIHFKKVLSIDYLPFERQAAQTFQIHPYYLKQYNGRWFLFGLNEERQKADWNLPLDRILSIQEVNKKYKKNTVIDWQEYFEDIIGVTKASNKQPEKIVLHFFGVTGRYIESKPLHGSQRSKWISNDVLEVTLDVIINYEFERLVLSYGESVQVISPTDVRSRVQERLSQAALQYS